MDTEDYFMASAYRGSKDFSQQQIHTANATGFGAAADDYAERGIDLNEQLVKNKMATFFMRVTSEAMTGAGIFPGDVVIVDRSLEARNGSVIITAVDGELLIRKLEKSGNKMMLHAANTKVSAMDISAKGLVFWGVVTYVIHAV